MDATKKCCRSSDALTGAPGCGTYTMSFSKPEGDMDQSDESERFWEERFPGKGGAIMEVLRPFFHWKPELKPALPDLETRATSAVDWRPMRGVKTFRASDAAALESSLWVSVWDSLEDTLEEALKPALADVLVKTCLESLAPAHRALLHPSFEDSLRSLVRNSLEDRFESVLWSALRDAFPDPLRRALRETFVQSRRTKLSVSLEALCFFSIGFIFAEKPVEAAAFRPLLELFLAGNYPMGFDKDDNLLVLVA